MTEKKKEKIILYRFVDFIRGGFRNSKCKDDFLGDISKKTCINSKSTGLKYSNIQKHKLAPLNVKIK